MILAIIGVVSGLGLSTTIFFLWRSRKYWKETAIAESMQRSIEEQKAANAHKQLKNHIRVVSQLETTLATIRLRYEAERKKSNASKKRLTTAVAKASGGNREELAKLLAEAHGDD